MYERDGEPPKLGDDARDGAELRTGAELRDGPRLGALNDDGALERDGAENDELSRTGADGWFQLGRAELEALNGSREATGRGADEAGTEPTVRAERWGTPIERCGSMTVMRWPELVV